MGDQKRGDDAADHAPAVASEAEPDIGKSNSAAKAVAGASGGRQPSADQDAVNYRLIDRGLAEPVENISSANDG